MHQGCQIFLGTQYQNRTKCTKGTQNVPNGHKISQMAIKYINIFPPKALQNLPKSEFLVWKETIWPPWHAYIPTRTSSIALQPQKLEHSKNCSWNSLSQTIEAKDYEAYLCVQYCSSEIGNFSTSIGTYDRNLAYVRDIKNFWYVQKKSSTFCQL
jgi:hypothetical protein